MIEKMSSNREYIRESPRLVKIPEGTVGNVVAVVDGTIECGSIIKYFMEGLIALSPGSETN